MLKEEFTPFLENVLPSLMAGAEQDLGEVRVPMSKVANDEDEGFTFRTVDVRTTRQSLLGLIQEPE